MESYGLRKRIRDGLKLIIKITIFIVAMILLLQLILKVPWVLWKIDLRWSRTKGLCPYCRTGLITVDDGIYTIYHCHKCKFKISDQTKDHHKMGIYDSYHQHGFRTEIEGS